MVPLEKIPLLPQIENVLTTKQGQDIINALNSQLPVILKPTKKQIGSRWGTILASIGIPMLVDAIKGKGSSSPRRLRSLSIPGSGLNISPRPGIMMQYYPPPFIGNWPQNTVGMGKKKISRGQKTINMNSRSLTKHKLQQKSIVKNSSLRPNNLKFINKSLSNSGAPRAPAEHHC